jgi:hypothetical protein
MRNIEMQAKLISHGLLDPPADGKWGIQSRTALQDFQLKYQLKVTGDPDPATIDALGTFAPEPLEQREDFASKIISYMQRQGHFIARGPGRYTIVYVEGANPDGTINDDAPNGWNDARVLVEIIGTRPRIIGGWDGTSEPGDAYTQYPMNPDGAFRIAFGQYKAWCVGIHRDYPALVQVADITGYRDYNKDFQRTNDRLVTGNFGVNQHHGYDMDQIYNASAGCLVGRTRAGHQEFMNLVSADRRYQVNNGYQFFTAVIPGDKL